MAFRPATYDDIVNSKYATAMPAATVLPQTETRNYFQAIDNLIKVYAIRPGDSVLFLTDPLLDRRIVDAISGIANSRGVFPREFIAPTTQLGDCPPEAVALVEQATFVISTWFCSVNSPRMDDAMRSLKLGLIIAFRTHGDGPKTAPGIMKRMSWPSATRATPSVKPSRFVTEYASLLRNRRSSGERSVSVLSHISKNVLVRSCTTGSPPSVTAAV
jgi:hypothetical protein